MEEQTSITPEEAQIKKVINKYIACSWGQLLFEVKNILF